MDERLNNLYDALQKCMFIKRAVRKGGIVAGEDKVFVRSGVCQLIKDT